VLKLFSPPGLTCRPRIPIVIIIVLSRPIPSRRLATKPSAKKTGSLPIKHKTQRCKHNSLIASSSRGIVQRVLSRPSVRLTDPKTKLHQAAKGKKRANQIARPLPRLVQRYKDSTSLRFAGVISRECPWPLICASVEIMTLRKLRWYSVLSVTTAASCARTMISHARITPSLVSVDNLSASSRRIRLPWRRYCVRLLVSRSEKRGGWVAYHAE
jgi:hypothetical protein